MYVTTCTHTDSVSEMENQQLNLILLASQKIVGYCSHNIAGNERNTNHNNLSALIVFSLLRYEERELVMCLFNDCNSLICLLSAMTKPKPFLATRMRCKSRHVSFLITVFLWVYCLAYFHQLIPVKWPTPALLIPFQKLWQGR